MATPPTAADDEASFSDGDDGAQPSGVVEITPMDEDDANSMDDANSFDDDDDAMPSDDEPPARARPSGDWPDRSGDANIDDDAAAAESLSPPRPGAPLGGRPNDFGGAAGGRPNDFGADTRGSPSRRSFSGSFDALPAAGPPAARASQDVGEDEYSDDEFFDESFDLGDEPERPLTDAAGRTLGRASALEAAGHWDRIEAAQNADAPRDLDAPRDFDAPRLAFDAPGVAATPPAKAAKSALKQGAGRRQENRVVTLAKGETPLRVRCYMSDEPAAVVGTTEDEPPHELYGDDAFAAVPDFGRQKWMPPAPPSQSGPIFPPPAAAAPSWARPANAPTLNITAAGDYGNDDGADDFAADDDTDLYDFDDDDVDNLLDMTDTIAAPPPRLRNDIAIASPDSSFED
mmetsp:Transcript_3199/g.11453  ORF Transcript_3199/g.11453 Transcript_3199/m.11453 type:complete len:402 (-) Transcript_3199:86-1291(-)